MNKDQNSKEGKGLNTGIITVIVETHEDSKKSLKARLSDDSVTFADSLKSASELLFADSGIKNVIFKLKSYKDKDFSQDAISVKNLLLDLVWNRQDLLGVIGNAIENDIAIGVVVENPDAAFTKFSETLKMRGANIETFKDLPVTVKADDFKTIVTDQLDGVGTGDIDMEEKDDLIAKGDLLLVTNWPKYVNKMTTPITKSDTGIDSKVDENQHVSQK